MNRTNSLNLACLITLIGGIGLADTDFLFILMMCVGVGAIILIFISDFIKRKKGVEQ